ncbi:MAG: protein kinase [Planctomycetes bacterium]|nr:protein kinase [Planctomycetota bacterium]
MPKLLVEKGPNKDLEITVGKTVFAGRDTSAHIMLTEPMVSRLHFKIEHRPDGYYLSDLDSLNGTFVNRARVRERLLKPGDMIQVGDTIFSFVSDDPAAQQKSLVGKIVGGYSIIERIGRGGMGTVYKALQISLKRTVALKILSEDMLKDKTFIEMFLQEARSAGQLNHNNIVQVYDVGRTPEDIYYFSMEYMSGGSIQELLIKRTRLPLFQSVKMMLDAAAGLSYAEKKGIVHRDIKPDNLMISEDDIVKIGDLGLAKSVSSSQQEKQSNTLMGTPHYLAPEQAQGKAVDHRSDIYSLGASFYRIISGSTPYSASSVKDIIVKKLREDPRPLKEILPSAPDSVVKVISRMMKRKIDERYANSAELIKDLKVLKDELDPDRPKPIADIPLVPAGPELPEAEKALRKSPFVRLGLPAILLVMTIGVIFLLGHYYSDIKKTPANTGDSTGGITGTSTAITATGSSDYEEKLAQEYLSKARAYEAGLTPDSTRDAINKGIPLYERIITECARSKLVKNAREGVGRLNQLIKALEEKEKQRLLADEVLASLGQLESRINASLKVILESAGEGDALNLAQEFVKNSSAELDKFSSQYPRFTSVKERVETKKTVLIKWLDSIRATGEKYQSLKEQSEISVKSERFAQALKSITAFADNPAYQNTVYDNIARNYYRQVESQAKKSFSGLLLRVEDLKDKGQLTEAQKLLSAARSTYGVEEIENRIKDYLDWFDGQKGEIHKQELQKETAIFPQYLTPLFWFLQSGQFDEWAKAESQAKSTFQTREYQEKFAQYLSLMKMEKGLIDRFIDRFEKRKLDRPVLQGKEISSIDAKSGLIYFTLKDSPPLKFQEISIRDWEICLTNSWDLDARDFFDLGMLCIYRGGNILKAEESFNKALQKRPNRELQDLLKQYRPRDKLEELKKGREDDAELVRQLAEKLYDNKQQPQALDAFQLLRYRFVNTLVYTNNKTAIDTKIKLLGGK